MDVTLGLGVNSYSDRIYFTRMSEHLKKKKEEKLYTMREETFIGWCALFRMSVAAPLTRPGYGSNPRALDGCHESSGVSLHPHTAI